SLENWTPAPTRDDAVFTTVTHWWGDWVDDYDNTKRAAFLPYLDLPTHSPRQLELAVELEEHKEEHKEDWRLLRHHGWRVRWAPAVTPRRPSINGTSRTPSLSSAVPSPPAVAFKTPG